MASQSVLKATARQGSGSSVARRLRRQGVVPGIVNNNKGKSESVQVSKHEFEQLMHGHAGENVILDLVVDEAAPRKVLIKGIQHHPVTGDYLHADFFEISMTEKMRVRIPVRVVGDPVGVLQEGGILEQILREVEVECLPGDLVDQIDVDVSGLHINTSLSVGAIQVSDKLVILTNKDIAVALVSEPKAEEEVAAPVEGAAVAGEPEVIGAKKEEGEEEAEGAGGDKKGGDKKADDKAAKADDKKKPDDKKKADDKKKPEGKSK